MSERKGARSVSEVPAEILKRLNSGEIQTANLVEWLAIDQEILLQNVLKQIGKSEFLEQISAKLKELKNKSANSVGKTIAAELFKITSADKSGRILKTLSAHASDTVRCWAAHITACDESLDILSALNAVKPFAADPHFGVREIAWLCVRSKIIANLDESIEILAKYALDKDANIRRFASEATRPRGVWCEHINALKDEPWRALCILEPLKSDSSKYVQDSVANWLNDASKTQGEFVRSLCARWSEQSRGKQTAYIVKRALRTLNKKV